MFRVIRILHCKLQGYEFRFQVFGFVSKIHGTRFGIQDFHCFGFRFKVLGSSSGILFFGCRVRTLGFRVHG